MTVPNEYNDGKTNLVTSISDINYYKNCKRKWNFASEIRQSYRPRRSPVYFTFGRAFHFAAEHYYDNLDHPARVMYAQEALENYIIEESLSEGIPPGDEQVVESIAFGQELVAEFAEWAESVGGGIPFKFEVVSTEEAHTIHLFDNIYYGFRTDLIIREIDSSRIWLVDFKTTASLPTEQMLDYLITDEQTSAYLCASEKVYGCTFAGIIFMFACTKRFQEPRILKKGGLSKNASQYTTANRFKQAVSRLNLNPEDYYDIINIIKMKSVFKTSTALRSKEEKEYFWNHNLTPVVREMTSDPFIYPSPSRMNCSLCSYVHACTAVNDPRFDPKADLEVNYVKSEPRYQTHKHSQKVILHGN